MEQPINMTGGGVLSFCQEGTRVRFEASRPKDDRGLYKVWLKGERGGRLLLGTMIPEGNALRLGRHCSVSELERAGCWPPAGAESVLAFRFRQEGWCPEPHPERFVAGAEIRKLNGQVMARRVGEGTELSVPFRTDMPFPIPSLFCLARVEGRTRLIWRFDREGRPEHPGTEKKMGPREAR